jgi:hypothetical protein
VQRIVRRRQIREIVHFTPSKALLGILAVGAALSRVRISDEEILTYIAQVNTNRVLDPGYEDYVNLSISSINSAFFDVSASRWHPTADWALLAFDPVILEHEGVQFCSTNNGYPACRRARGHDGLEAVFASTVAGKYGRQVLRKADIPDNLTTDEQAEVLYPERLSTEYLRTIYVRSPEFSDQVHAHMAVVNHPGVEVLVAPARFKLHGARVR